MTRFYLLKGAWDHWLDLVKVVAKLLNECLEHCILKRCGYLTRAWNNAPNFKRASRSLAKTGLSGPPSRVKNHSVYSVFRRWSWKLGILTCNFLMCLFTFWFNLCDFLMCILHFHSLFSVGCQNAFPGGLTCNFLMCLLHFSCVIRHFLMCLLQFWHLQASLWEPIGAWHATSSCVYCIFHAWSSISFCV